MRSLNIAIGLANFGLLIFLTLKNRKFMSTTSDALKALNDKFNKAYGEITTKIQALTDAVNNNGDVLSSESQAALADLQATAQKFDDVVPDEVTTPDQGATNDQPQA